MDNLSLEHKQVIKNIIKENMDEQNKNEEKNVILKDILMINKINYDTIMNSFMEDYAGLEDSNITDDIAQSMMDKYVNKDNDLKGKYEKLENVHQKYNYDDILNKYDTCECIIDKLNEDFKHLVEMSMAIKEQAKILHEYEKMYTEIQLFINDMNDPRYGNICCSNCLKIYELDYECDHMSDNDSDYGDNDIDIMIERYEQYCNECIGEPLCSHCWYASLPPEVLL